MRRMPCVTQIKHQSDGVYICVYIDSTKQLSITTTTKSTKGSQDPIHAFTHHQTTQKKKKTKEQNGHTKQNETITTITHTHTNIYIAKGFVYLGPS